MRVKIARLIFIILVINIVALFYSWQLINKKAPSTNKHVNNTHKTAVKTVNKHISKLVSVVVRDFDLSENDVTLTIESVLNVFPNIQVLIVCNDLPYPPLELMYDNHTYGKNVKIIDLSLNLNVPVKERHPVFSIKSKYVLFLPDSSRITSRQIVQTLISNLVKNPRKIIAVPFANTNFKTAVKCSNVELNVKEWTLKYKDLRNANDTCYAVSGKHAFLIETQVLRECADAFLLPFPDALYIQTTALGVQVKLLTTHFLHNGKPLHRSHHAQWKYKQVEDTRRQQMYERFSIKKVVREASVEWYGCTRETARCFGTVVDSMPSYLYSGRWTPPCCLDHLRNVALHVFEILDSAKVQYWLDGGSLLGAMRRSDILLWDHDVDVGIYRNDLDRCDLLHKAKTKPFTDAKGYVWEKATEGDFYRVQYSKTNRIHVNIFPFFARNGTMTKDTWFTSHKNVEFPEIFLNPRSSIDFINRYVPSPNNIRDFLEIKYGKGVIENPQYPNPKKLKFV